MVVRSSYNPDKDIPSLKGKVILITGSKIGLRKQSALELSKHRPAQIWIAARNAQKTKAAIAEINRQGPTVLARFLEIGLASFESIKNGARTFLASATRLDILLLNAGIMGCPASQTKEGYEMQFGTNHVGHALLVKLLMPLLERTASGNPGQSVRIVSVSSVGHEFPAPGGIDFSSLKINGESLSLSARYGKSKLANIIYAQEIAKRHPSVASVSIHPGTVKTDFQTANGGDWMVCGFQKIVVPLIAVSVEEGVKSQLWAATADGVVSGEYYEPVGVPGKGSPLSKDSTLANKLWEWTENELREYSI